MHLKILVAQAFAVGGPPTDGMVHDDYFISVRGGYLASREDIRAPLDMGGLS